MTIKEAILKSLDDIKHPADCDSVYKHIVDHGYYHFIKAKTPKQTVSSRLGDFIRSGDNRVRREKLSRGNSAPTFYYYLVEHEAHISMDAFNSEGNNAPETIAYQERDLHMLLSTYLKGFRKGIYSKTISHESSNKNDKTSYWIHPDMVGVEFLDWKSSVGKSFLKSVNPANTFVLSSYELKREINSDSEFKQAFFQAVSNSSWAHYGYLVAFEFGGHLNEEIERLSEFFGIGIIKLQANPHESKTISSAKYRDLDFRAIDKLCAINNDFENFIDEIEKQITVDKKYFSAARKEFTGFCDDYLKGDSAIEQYCNDKGIPFEPE